MSRRDVRIVIGEGGSSRRGLLRFVLEGEGFEVVGEADQHADLVHVVALLKPDVVVLDDGIGVAAVGMVREIAPHAKVVLVWPQAVVPVGGDARVEPSHVVQELGPSVERVASALIGPATQSYRRPEWVDRVRKDPAALRELLTRSGGATTESLNVSQLQRRIADAQRREQESAVQPAAASADEPVVHDAEGAAVLILPASEDAGPAAAERERARRIGTIALGAAAVSAALVFALALGGSRIPVLVVGEGPRPSVSPPPPVVSPSPDGEPGNGDTDGNEGNGDGRGAGQDPDEYGPAPTAPTVGPGDGLTPVSAGGGGGNEPGGGGDPTGSGGDGTGGDGGTSGDGGTGGELPGKSALFNPYGGPPGILGFTPKPWVFIDGVPGFAGEHGLAGGIDRVGDDPAATRDARRLSDRPTAESTPGRSSNARDGRSARERDDAHRRPSGRHASNGSVTSGGTVGGDSTPTAHADPGHPGNGSRPPAHAGGSGPPAHASGTGPPAHAHKH